MLRTFLNDSTIEERVSMLEFQVAELAGDLDSVEEEVTVISTEQILQDGRILELEIDADGNNSRVYSRSHLEFN